MGETRGGTQNKGKPGPAALLSLLRRCLGWFFKIISIKYAAIIAHQVALKRNVLGRFMLSGFSVALVHKFFFTRNLFSIDLKRASRGFEKPGCWEFFGF